MDRSYIQEDESARLRCLMGQIIHLVHLHHRMVERCFRGKGIHPSQMRLLAYLADYEPLTAQKQAAAALRVSPVAASALLKRLEKAGYVARNVMREDERRYCIRLTQAGRDKLTQTRLLMDGVDRTLFCGLTEEELEQLARLVGKLEQNLVLSAGAAPDTAQM